MYSCILYLPYKEQKTVWVNSGGAVYSLLVVYYLPGHSQRWFINSDVYCSSVLSSVDKIQSCYGSNFSSILPSVLIYWVFILQNNVCEVFNILHLEVMIIEIVLSMQFFSKQNNSSVFVLGLAGKKSVSSFFTPIQLCEWTPSRREMRKINVEIQTLYGS